MDGIGMNRSRQGSRVDLTGRLLIAAPGWDHSLHARSVCYLIGQTEAGSVAVTLNRSMSRFGKGLLSAVLPEAMLRQLELVHLGGPSSGPLVAIHRCSPLAEFEIEGGICFTASVAKLRELLVKDPAELGALKLVVGKTSWAGGELEQQLETGRWLVLPALPRVVFADSECMWEEAMREIGNRYVAAITNARVLPPQWDYN